MKRTYSKKSGYPHTKIGRYIYNDGDGLGIKAAASSAAASQAAPQYAAHYAVDAPYALHEATSTQTKREFVPKHWVKKPGE